ncbi:MAG: glutathione S-transferase C-terminal domain-containing protein [Sulfuricellaceae bacterium]|nr:glutathione S-transferase C-terminal domain-containing protein [Sulfuricellaceae bacterium]
MKLLASLTSPFARKVRIVLSEKHIECQLDVMNPWEAGSPVLDFNPLGQVPTLVLDDGMAVFDSSVIVEYLDAMSPVNKLIPEPGRQRVQVRRWEALADGVADAAARIFREKGGGRHFAENESPQKMRVETKQDDAWISLQRGAIDRGLDALEQELGDRPWFYGHGLSLADIAVACCLGYLDLRFPEIEWRHKHAGLAQHMDKLMLRPSFAESAPPG